MPGRREDGGVLRRGLRADAGRELIRGSPEAPEVNHTDEHGYLLSAGAGRRRGARLHVRLAERAADAERVNRRRPFAFDIFGSRSTSAGDFEPGCRRGSSSSVSCCRIGVVDLELEVHVEMGLVRDLAELHAAVAGHVHVAALRDDLRDLGDAVLRPRR